MKSNKRKVPQSKNINEKSSNSKNRGNNADWFAVVISVISLVLTVLINWHNIYPGEISPLKPSSYAIIRGVSHFPSDHLVLPLEWLNSTRNSILIRYPTLILKELDVNHEEIGTTYRFTVDGEFSEISNESFAASHTVSSSFALQPHSVSKRILIFHIDKWWDPNSENYGFRFKSGQTFRVYVEYNRFKGDKKSHSEKYLFDLAIYGSADSLTLRTEGVNWWDYWHLE